MAHSIPKANQDQKHTCARATFEGGWWNVVRKACAKQCVAQWRVALCCVVLFCDVLCCAVLCCAVLAVRHQ
eukprot:13533069-Alexandrium_andersonii.AAC.1